MDMSLNGHRKGPNVVAKWLWYEGTDAITEGEAVVFKSDFGVAANVDGRRCNHVVRPGAGSVAADFAGVCAGNHAASATGQLIEVYAPGSMGVIAQLGAGVTTVIGTGVLVFTNGGTFIVGAGAGQGFAIPRQTQATAAGKVQVDLMTGATVFPAVAAQANSVAVDAAGIVVDFNALLAKLRTAGVLLT